MWINSFTSSEGPTVHFEVHAPEDQRADVLGLHLPPQVHEDGGQVAVGVVGDAGGGDGLEELGLGELPGQRAEVLVDEGAQRDAGKRRRFHGSVRNSVS